MIKMKYSDIVDDKKWKSYSEYFKTEEKEITEDIKKSIKHREKLREETLKKVKEHIQKTNKEKLDWASKMLYTGNVAGIDGTISIYPLSTGTRYRIGVVSTSYKNEKIEKVLFISQSELAECDDYEEHYDKMEDITPTLFRTIMFYKERDIALNRKEEWRFVHGPLLPMELFFENLKIEDAYEKNLELAKRLVEAKKIIGVIGQSTNIELLQQGSILNTEPPEYIFAYTKDERLLSNAVLKHLTLEHRKKFETFAKNFASKIKIGIFRVGSKPFIFEAHEDVFDEAAHLIIKDSMTQRMRGFPLLIDYADSVCKKLLASGDFKKCIEHKLIKIGGFEGFGFDIPERMTRRR